MIRFTAEPDYANSTNAQAANKWKGVVQLDSGDVVMETDYLFDSSFTASDAVRTEFLNRFRDALGVRPIEPNAMRVRKPSIPAPVEVKQGDGDNGGTSTGKGNPYETST